MSFRNNGRRRDPKKIICGIFLGIIAIILGVASFSGGFSFNAGFFFGNGGRPESEGFDFAWFVIAIVVGYFSFACFKNSNEL